MPKLKMTPFVAAGFADALVRGLRRLPGLTREDKRALMRIRAELCGVRLRHMPRPELDGLPEDVARCLSGPAVDAPQLTVSGAGRRA